MSKRILVIGAGPSGLCTATFLHQKGYEVTVIERKVKKEMPLKIGESLPPDAKQFLEQLDIWEQFQEDGHLKYYSNKSIWGQDQIHYTDFIHHPIGHGWHLDRNRFEEMLFTKVKDLDIPVVENTSALDVHFEDGHWEVILKTNKQKAVTSNYDFLVDASGRNSWLGRKLGHERLYEDQQLALISFLKCHKDMDDTSSLIETATDGWWYSTKIPGDRIAMAFLCKPDTSKRETWIQEDNWWALLKKSPHTAKRILDCEGVLLEAPRFVSAAMVSARDAGNAIEQYFQDSPEAMESYAAVLAVAFQHYTQQRIQFYQSEQRFENSTYWNAAMI